MHRHLCVLAMFSTDPAHNRPCLCDILCTHMTNPTHVCGAVLAQEETEVHGFDIAISLNLCKARAEARGGGRLKL